MCISAACALLLLCAAAPAAAQAPAPEPAVPVIAARHLFDLEADFLHPSDVAVGAEGRVYVVDGVNGQVKIFDSAGKFLSSFGEKGAGRGKLNHPLGIDIAQNGAVYIADSGNHCVQVFDPAGRFQFEFPVAVKDSPRQPDPVDVVVDSSRDRCYVVDNDNHRILAYTRDGSRLIKVWGSRGEKPGEFNFPFFAARDSYGILYAVDVLNTRVQAISDEGRTIALIGKWGVDRGQFYRPKGVTIDKKDRIYVSDSFLGVVQVFKRYNTFLGVIGTESGQRLHFTTPTGIYIDATLRLYVVEMRQNRVRVYQIVE